MESYNIRGSHPVMQAILGVAERIATTDVCALIVGEPGTGKELIARYIHYTSSRADGPFVRVDCMELAMSRNGSGLSSALAHEGNGNGNGKGNGLVRTLQERARGGTLFLDHVGALGSDAQQRLRAGLFTPAAAGEFRLVASREPLDPPPSFLTDAGLAMIEISVPALRQRRSDIPVLVEHFLELYVERHGLTPRRVDTEAMVQLWQYDWPGNVRQLETTLERLVVLSRSGVIRTADLPPTICTVARRPARAAAVPLHI